MLPLKVDTELFLGGHVGTQCVGSEVEVVMLTPTVAPCLVRAPM